MLDQLTRQSIKTTLVSSSPDGSGSPSTEPKRLSRLLVLGVVQQPLLAADNCGPAGGMSALKLVLSASSGEALIGKASKKVGSFVPCWTLLSGRIVHCSLWTSSSRTLSGSLAFWHRIAFKVGFPGLSLIEVVPLFVIWRFGEDEVCG